MRRMITLATLATLTLTAPSPADAFCGFYVSGADGDMFNNATQVVMMRKGTRTVLSMQNNYQGPTKDFAMIVPVPVVLQKENVKTLPKDIFKKVDRLAAPRLVEYWEKDPCMQDRYPESVRMASKSGGAPGGMGYGRGSLGVKIEAQFTVGEYEIVILSARDSTGLDTWLRREKYNIPKDAEPLLKPYVQAGSKFFVAKVNVAKVVFKDGMADLSPLRFHYDHKDFQLPIRLGMANSAGTQDLIVHILSPGQRYEVANYTNVTIPTNIDVTDDTRKRFGEFYAALFDKTVEKNPGAVITEYAWDSGTCDPCPTPPLRPNDLATLGADVLDGGAAGGLAAPGRGRFGSFGGMVLTRLHARYKKGAIKDDLVFKAAGPIMGGREVRIAGNKLEERARPSGMNNFQGRYAIRHEWTGPIECTNPVRGRWGGPPGGGGIKPPEPALDLAFAPRGKVTLASMVHTNIPEIDVRAAGVRRRPTAPGGQALPDGVRPPGTKPGGHRSKAKHKGCSTSGGDAGGMLLLAFGALIAVRRRRA